MYEYQANVLDDVGEVRRSTTEVCPPPPGGRNRPYKTKQNKHTHTRKKQTKRCVSHRATEKAPIIRATKQKEDARRPINVERLLKTKTCRKARHLETAVETARRGGRARAGSFRVVR